MNYKNDRFYFDNAVLNNHLARIRFPEFLLVIRYVTFSTSNGFLQYTELCSWKNQNQP